MHSKKTQAIGVSGGLALVYTYLFLGSLATARFQLPLFTASHGHMLAWALGCGLMVSGLMALFYRPTASLVSRYLAWVLLFNALILGGLMAGELTRWSPDNVMPLPGQDHSH